MKHVPDCIMFGYWISTVLYLREENERIKVIGVLFLRIADFDSFYFYKLNIMCVLLLLPVYNHSHY